MFCYYKILPQIIRIKRITMFLGFWRYAYDFTEFNANTIVNQCTIINTHQRILFLVVLHTGFEFSLEFLDNGFHSAFGEVGDTNVH